MDNPFTIKAEKAWALYHRYSGTSAADKAMAESFPAGPGCGPRNGIDASVDRSVKAVYWFNKARVRSAQAEAFERGEINRQGYPIKARPSKDTSHD